MSKKKLSFKNDENKLTITSPEIVANTRKLVIRIRWRKAFEKIKMKQLFQNEETTKDKRFIDRHLSKEPSVHRSPKKILGMLSANIIAQKFASILKKQFKSLSAKQYTMINDICYVDVAEDIKRRQKLKKKLEMNVLNASDKETKKSLVLLIILFFSFK